MSILISAILVNYFKMLRKEITLSFRKFLALVVIDQYNYFLIINT